MLTSTLVRLWRQIPSRRKTQLLALAPVIGITSVFEMLTVASVLPFLGVFFSVSNAANSETIAFVMKLMGTKGPGDLLRDVTIIFVGFVIVSAILRLTLLWAQIRVAHSIGADLSLKMFETALDQPYEIHVKRNSSAVISGIASKANSVVYSGIIPAMTIVGSLTILLAVFIVLASLNLMATLVIILSTLLAYSLIVLRFRKILNENSKKMSQTQNIIVKTIQESLGGIRDVIINRSKKYFVDLFRKSDLGFRDALTVNELISASPRLIIEAVGILVLVSFAYNLSSLNPASSDTLPILGAFAVGAQRLLPVAQQLYASWSNLKSGESSLIDVIELLEQSPSLPEVVPSKKSLSFTSDIKALNVSYRYSHSTPWILRDVKFDITKGSIVGFIGTTGSGKSTLIDLLMGLLVPVSGHFAVDDVIISEINLAQWQRKIAHVPQNIYLTDSSVLENIAFGLPRDEIDIDRVMRVAELAQVSNEIESLPLGYNTVIGERGVRLSGGQRQRIGIARALYRNSEVLVFDEATNALDSETEQLVIERLRALDRAVTVVMITHRLSTLQYCDLIYKVSNGNLLRYESYQKMMMAN